MIINKEKQLLDALNRIERNPKNTIAVYVSLSKLKGKSKSINLNFAYKVGINLSPILQTSLFGLSNGDMIIIGKNLSLTAVDDIIQKIISVLKKDEAFEKNKKSLFKTYNLEYEFLPFKDEIVKGINQAINTSKKNDEQKVKLTPDTLDGIIRTLDSIDVGSVIRRQAIAKVIKGKKFEIVFKEYFLSIKDLNNKLSSNISLTDDYWLFRYLTEQLDKKMLKKIKDLPKDIKKPLISLNLNISSIFSDEFREYVNKNSDEKIICEFQIVDILNDFDGYLKAKEYLHKQGHKVLIDCLSTIELDFIDIDVFKPDYVKIIWNEDILEDKRYTLIKELAFKIGGKKIILSRADSDKALSFGNALGIELYQGYYVDTINAVFSKTNCKYGAKCSLEKCANAKREISGNDRKQCANQALLDKDPVLKNF